MFYRLNKHEFIKIFFFSAAIILPKWILSYYFFDEDISTKIINEINGDGEFYLPHIKYLAEFNFTQSFSPEVKNLRWIPIPIGSLFIHSFFYIFIGNYSIIFLELLFCFLYIYFFLLTQKIYFNNHNILSISILIILLPTLITILGMDNINYLNTFSNNFFNFRIHRPLSTSLFLIIFIFLTIEIFKNSFLKRYGFFLGLILGLTLSSFYYFFLMQIISLFLLISYKFKLNLFKFIGEHKLFILFLIFGFLLPTIPFIFNLLFYESDYGQRIGLIFLDNQKKNIIFNYYFELFINIKFLLFILSNIIFFVINLKFNYKNYYFFLIPFIIFISSIFSPLVFILLSNKISLIYHFNNNIILSSVIFLIFSSISIFHSFRIKNNKFNFAVLIIFLFTIFYNSNLYVKEKYDNLETRRERIEFSIITKKILENDLNELSILTFDDNLTIWSIMNNINNLKIINGLLVPKKNETIEKEIIETFKFLDLSKKNFIQFIENKDNGWRYYNKDVGKFFYLRYQANRLKTYKDSKNFNHNEIIKIQNSSPALNQQIIIPIDEKNRLISDFNEYENFNYKKPNIIVLNKNDFLFKNSNLSLNEYCLLFDDKTYIAFTDKNCS